MSTIPHPTTPAKVTWYSRWVTNRAFLRVPLWAKLAGANGLVVLSALAVITAHNSEETGSAELALVVVTALVLSIVANLVLVSLALRPLGEVEATAARVCGGELSARVPLSPLADREMARVGEALNLALDELTADRHGARMLAVATVSAAEAERARIARELHESLAQSLAALTYQLSAAVHEARPRSTC